MATISPTDKGELLGCLLYFIVTVNSFPDETCAETLYHQHTGKHVTYIFTHLIDDILMGMSIIVRIKEVSARDKT